jgi:O-antigen ligase
MTINILSFTLILSVLLFGTVEIWSSTIILLFVFTLGLLWVLRREYARFKIAGSEILLLATWISFLIYTILQVLPFPSFFLNFISPSAFKIQTFYSFESNNLLYISLHPYGTVMEILRFTALFITFVIVMQNVKDWANLKRMLKILVVFGFILAVFAIIQKAAWNGKLYWFRELTQGGTPFGPFVNRNHFAGFIGMLIPLSLGFSLTRKRTEKKMLYGFMTVIMAVSLFFSLSRGGIIAFIAGITLFSLLMIKSSVQSRKVWAIGFFLSVLTAYLLYLGIDPVIERFYKTDIDGEARLIVWSATLNAFKDFWFTGSGLGTFINIFPLYSPVETQRSIYAHAHNDYLEFILETGIIGVLLLIAFASLIIYSIARSSLQGKTGILTIAAVSSAFTIVVHSIFDFNLHILSNALLFSAVLGMVIALSNKDYIKVEGRKK